MNFHYDKLPFLPKKLFNYSILGNVYIELEIAYANKDKELELKYIYNSIAKEKDQKLIQSLYAKTEDAKNQRVDDLTEEWKMSKTMTFDDLWTRVKLEIVSKQEN